MKGIQINNFFNNHISLNPKKPPPKQPHLFAEPPRPEPILFNNHDEEPDQIASYDALTPQMKAFGKQQIVSGRKKRTNTIENSTKPRENKKSKGKKSCSQEMFRKTLSLDKCNQKDISEDQDVSKTLNKQYKKPKTSRNKIQPSEGVKRSKSAIIKNTSSKTIQSKQPSRHFLKQPAKKVNIISADSSFKDASRKEIKKETQNLIKKKEHVDKFQCKTARVQSTKIKPRKNKDKIIGDINKSAEKDDKKVLKFLTERKTTGVTASKSYLTSAKQSKPNSARQKKPSKKLFDSKEKDYRIEDEGDTYRNLQNFIKDTTRDQNQQVKEALNQLQSVLQGISSKKDLAKELKKFTFKLKQYPSKQTSDDNNSSLSQVEKSNSEPFQKIKDFKNNLVKKKLNEVKETVSKQEEPQAQRQQQVSTSKKSSSKKLAKLKKKLQEPQKNVKKPVKAQNLESNQGQMLESSNQNQDTSEPQAFKNTQEEESQYINSSNVSQFQEKDKGQAVDLPEAIHSQDDSEDTEFDAKNRNYMESFKNLQLEGQNDSENNFHQKNVSNSGQDKNQNLIDDISTYPNRDYIQINREYNSEKPKESKEAGDDVNPILKRREYDGYPAESKEKAAMNEKYLNYLNNDEEHNLSGDESHGNSYDKTIKFSEIEELKSFQKQSDQMMTKVGLNPKLEQKKKNLTIELNQNIAKIAEMKSSESKTPSSPKYDDRYPHMVKSPKFSDIEITNILAAKQKCLESKHQKMNQLVQRMYEKQLVSPKSYEYYVYQLKKQYQEESQGFDGFKEQASEILNEINQEKNDIKVIDELIREEKWQEARKLMKGDHKTASSFFGFKKNKDKVYEVQDTKMQIPVSSKDIPVLSKEISMEVEVEVSPTKRRNNVAVVQNNIQITIMPQAQSKTLAKYSKRQEKPKEQEISSPTQKVEISSSSAAAGQAKQSRQRSRRARQKQIRQAYKIQYQSDSQYESDDLQTAGMILQSITRPIEMDFEDKYKLKTNDDEFAEDINRFEAEVKLDSELDSYLNADKAQSEDIQHYVYYHSEGVEDRNGKKVDDGQAQIKQDETKSQELGVSQVRPQGIFKLFEVPQTGQDQEQQQKRDDSQSNSSDKYQQVIIEPQSQHHNRQTDVIKIYQQQCNSQTELEQVNTLTSNKSFEKSKDQIYEEDNLSDSGSILQLQLRKGFESNLFFIKEYCISLCQYIRDNPGLKSQFRHDISQPLQFQTETLLKKYRTALDGTQTDDYNSTITPLQYKHQYRKPPNKAISSQLAEEFNKTYGPLKFWNKDLTKKGRERFNMEKQSQKIFLSAILQVLNESLDFERPGSIFGKPLAWANKSKHLKNMKYLHGEKSKKVAQDCEESAETYDFIFGVAIARIIQWGSCLCGFLPDTAELENTQIDDDYVVHIRETRMAFLLQKMLAEEEVTFNNSELEETEIMLLMGKLISQQLVSEAIQQISRLKEQEQHSFFNHEHHAQYQA